MEESEVIEVNQLERIYSTSKSKWTIPCHIFRRLIDSNKVYVSYLDDSPLICRDEDLRSIGETGPMLDTSNIFAIFRKIFVGIHF